MSSVPAGGPSTINGVLYQMFWALHRVGTLQAAAPVLDQTTGELTSICLILEPPDGGDQQEVQPGWRVVEQLKARSDEGAWSLQEVIKEVLPDLYRAVDLTRPATEYRFVTEGHRGKWQQVEDFFKSLRSRIPGGDLLASLDDTIELKFGRSQRASTDPAKQPFWAPGPYTERRLFEQIVAGLRQRDEVGKEPPEVTQRKLWHLLANFTFDGDRTVWSLQVAVDSWLKARVPAVEDLPRYRNDLLLDLARRASGGGARIVAAQFLAERGLNALPLTDWMRISDQAREELDATLRRRGFDPAEDARPDFIAAVAARWTAVRPVLVLTGESGQGKTWLGYALLARAANQQEVAILVEATGNAAADLAEGAAVFWQRIVGFDNAAPFVRICDRLRQVSPGREPRPLCLFVDRVTDPGEARRLTLEPWETWGMRLAMTCPPEVAAAIREVAPRRSEEIAVPDFSTAELHRYLGDCVGERWPDIPDNVRATLRRPLLAWLYRNLAAAPAWQPSYEYELYKRFWNRLYEGQQAYHPMDAENLRRAAYSLIGGATYPWTAAQLCQGHPDDSPIRRLLHLGWLRSPRPGLFEVWHNRLLNWAVAEGMVGELQQQRLDVAAACNIIYRLHSSPGPPGQQFLGYVPMDFLWLVLDPALAMGDLGVRILAALEGE